MLSVAASHEVLLIVVNQVKAVSAKTVAHNHLFLLLLAERNKTRYLNSHCNNLFRLSKYLNGNPIQGLERSLNFVLRVVQEV